MVWPLPPGATVSVLVAVALVWLGFAFERRGRWRLAILAVVGAALVVRVYASADWALHAWDERYHALVAKNLMTNPFVPTLYARPVLDYNYTQWTANHVWLHKPPLALWAMAASMRIFGVSEVAMRVPSVLASAATVVLTFGIASRLFDARVGLLAATFQTFNGLLVALASGRRPSDHVDTLLVFFVTLGVFAAMAVGRAGQRLAPLSVGAITGLALLTKGLPGLVILPIWAYLLWSLSGARSVFGRLLLSGIVALAVAAPWTVYIFHAFPREAAYEGAYALRHITELIEGQGGPVWQYLFDMPRFFGELVYVPLAWSIIAAGRPGADWPRRAIVIWVALPYIVYSGFATKMPAYVMVAAPAVFILEANFWLHVRRRLTTARSTIGRVLLATLLVLLAVLPARYLLEPTGPLERRDRNPQWARDLRSLSAQLGAQDAVLFNVPRPIEAMFYTRYTAYPHLPDARQLGSLRSQGLRVFVYDDGSQPFRITADVELPIIRPLR